MITGLLTQEGSGVGNPVWESIPMSIQTLVGVAAIMGAGWTWFVRPQMATIVAEAFARSTQKAREAYGDSLSTPRGSSGRIDSTRVELRREVAATRRELSAQIEELSRETARLAGAVDVLTSIWQEGNIQGEIGTQ